MKYDTKPGIDAVTYCIASKLEKFSLGAWINKIYEKRENKRTIAIDIYVVSKCAIAAMVLFSGVGRLSTGKWIVIIFVTIAIYSIGETLLSLFRKIFYPDTETNPSHRRASLLLLINWMEIILWYAVLYLLSDSVKFSNAQASMFDFFYFSFMHGATMDIEGASICGLARIISICQVMTFGIFIALFLSHNFQKIK